MAGSAVRTATPADGPECRQPIPMAMPLPDSETLNSTGVQRALTLAEPHRVRVVKLKAHKSIQVIGSHSYKEKRSQVGKCSQSLVPRQQTGYGNHILQEGDLGLPGGAGRFMPRTMIRCISVLLSSEKILQMRRKGCRVKDSSGTSRHSGPGWIRAGSVPRLLL